MNDLMAAIKQLTKHIDVLALAGWNSKPPPLLCRCGRLFRGGMKTWLPHFRKAHPKLAKRYDTDLKKDRGNLLLGMMRKARGGRRHVLGQR